MAGSLKVIYTQWCTRHIAAKHKGDHDVLPVVTVQSVPFNIKALEKGLAVESAWSSESTSPQLSQHDLSASPEISPITSRFDLQTTTLASTADNTVHPAFRTSQDAAAPRYDYIPHTLKSLQAQQTLKELDAVYRTPRWFREDSTSTFLIDADEDEPPPVTPPKSPKRYAKQQDASKPRQRSVDFTLIDRNRQAQAAETGQLKARAPKHLSVDIKAASLLSLSRTNTLPTLETSALPEVVPFAQFVQRTPTSPSTHSSWRDKNVQAFTEPAVSGDVSPMSPDFNRCASESTISQTPSPETASPHTTPPAREDCLAPPPIIHVGPFELEDTSPKRQWFEKVSSIEEQVIRGRNSGFEILKPGSLSERGRRNAPPISLLNRGGQNDETSRGRRLQKKRRNSIDSQVSTRSSSSNRSRLSFRSLFHRSKDDLSTN